MKYLVTGVAGFIASKTAELLLREGHSVVGIDNMNDYYDVRMKEYRLRQLMGLDGDFTFVKMDIEDLAATQAVFSEHVFDAIINLAARAGVRYSMENPYVYLSTNTLGTLNLLECMKEQGVEKFVLASTSSLYAGQPMPFIETAPVNSPISPYAASKKAAESMAYSYHFLYEIDVTILRYFTVFGPAGRPDMCIFRFIKWIDEGKPVQVYGDGTQSRDFTYVEDIAKGTILAATSRLGYEVINLGGGNRPVDLITIIKWIEEGLGKKAKIQNSEFHKADLNSSWADIEKAEKLLDWKPEVAAHDGVKACIEWHVANREWIAGVQL